MREEKEKESQEKEKENLDLRYSMMYDVCISICYLHFSFLCYYYMWHI